MIIQHNITALNANRMLNSNNSAVSKSLEKLSSGYKINRASDDAAGLAISEKMRAQITGLDRAESNAQDGISLVQTGEGALTEVHDMLNRMVDLTTQSANGTLTDEDRTKIVDEMASLKSEIDRVSTSTNFNGIKLIDGSLNSTKNSTIEGSSVINYTAAKAVGETVLDAAATLSGVALTTALSDKFTIDGVGVTVDWSSDAAGLSESEKALLTKTYAAGDITTDVSKELASIVQKGINNTITANKLGVAPVTVSVDSANKLNITSGLAGSAKSEVSVVAGGATSVAGKLIDADQDGDIVYKSADQKVTYAISAGNTFNMKINGVNTTATMTIVDNTITMSGVQAKLQTALEGAIDLYNANNNLAAGNEGFVDKTKLTVGLTDNGGFEIKNETGASMNFSDITTGLAPTATATKLGLVDAKGGTGTGGLTLQVGETSDSYQKVTVSVGDMSTKGLGIDTVEVTAQGMTDGALDKIKAAINTVSTNRSALGALQNRLEHTINSLGVTNENITAAESRIRDTDMAKEMMAYTKNNVLTQAAQSMLAQANQAPQSVLQLLK